MFKPNAQLALTMLLATLLCGLSCTSFQGSATEANLIELNQLVDGTQGRYSTLWTGTFYCGPTGGFHYFRHTMIGTRDRLLKIRTSEMEIPNPGKFPLPRSGWISIDELADLEDDRAGLFGSQRERVQD
jgi:hypothetical protein